MGLSRRGVLSGGAVIAVTVALVATSVVARVVERAGDTDGAHHRIEVSNSSCAKSWSPGPAGRQGYRVHNNGRAPIRVTVVHASTGGIYGQIWLLTAGTTQRFEVTLPRGTYRWRCVPIRGVAAVSPVRQVRGSGGQGAHELRPVSSGEITAAVDTYRSSVRRGLRTLVRDTARLTSAVDGGDLRTARRRWLVAHLDYERLGAAYDTFGDIEGAINGRPDSFARGPADPRFTGFLRLEYGLWHDQRATTLRPVARALDTSVRKLDKTFPSMATNPGDLPLRAHEILENTLQFELSGDTDQGGHSNLATASANVDGTEMVLASLAPGLRVRDTRLLGKLQHELRGLDHRLSRYRSYGGRVSIDDLSRSQRQRLDADVDAALEDLALVPGILQMPPAITPP